MFESPLLDQTYITQKGWPKDHPFCREEVTRTPDPYVPNVVRYQLRYFSKFSRRFHESGCKSTAFF